MSNNIKPNYFVPLGFSSIGQYQIITLIGQGSYAKIYKVSKQNSNKVLVLKQMQISQDEDSLEQFQTEVKILSTINSPYIIKYYDNFESPSSYNIITEYCENGDLGQLIAQYQTQSKKMNEILIWKFFIQISLGLQYLHSKKILHRDIKSNNIFLTKDLNAKIGDLGIAKILYNTSHAHTFIGTPYYLSPELCKDLPYDEKSDVWALGCVLYEMISLRHPFDADSKLILYSKIINDKYSEIDKSYSKEIRELVDILLTKDCKKRPTMDMIVKMEVFQKMMKKVGITDTSSKKVEVKSVKGIKKVKISAVEMNYQKYRERKKNYEKNKEIRDDNNINKKKQNASLMINVPASNLVRMIINKDNFLKKININSHRKKEHRSIDITHNTNISTKRNKNKANLSMHISNSNLNTKSIPTNNSITKVPKKKEVDKILLPMKAKPRSANRHIIKQIKQMKHIPLSKQKEQIESTIERRLKGRKINKDIDNSTLIEIKNATTINSNYNTINSKEENKENVFIVREINKTQEEIQKENEELITMKKRYEGKINLYREEMEKYSKDIYSHIMVMYKEMEKDNYDKVDEITSEIEKYIKENIPEKEKDFFNAFQYYILYDIKLYNINNEISQRKM